MRIKFQIEYLIREGRLQRFQAWKMTKITTLKREEGMATEGMMATSVR